MNQRAVTSSLVCDRPPETTQSMISRDLFTSFVVLILKPLWSYRFELFVLFLLGGAGYGLACLFDSTAVGVVVVSLVVLVLLSVRPVRVFVGKRFFSARVRRQWEEACRFGLVVSVNDRVPKILSVRHTSAGEVLSVQMPKSMSTVPLANASETLASNLSVREVRVERDVNRADLATVSIIRCDPLGDGVVLSWPQLCASRLSIWDDITVGIDELGRPVSINLIERNLSIAGEPGSGKSVSQSMVTATAALDPDCELYLFDGNQVEFAPWERCAKAFVGPSLSYASEVLSSLQTEMHRRYDVLKNERRRKISRGDGLSPIVVVVNELAYYLNTGDSKSDKAIAGQLRSLVAQGRAAGIICVTATQKPSADVIPSYLRDLFAYRWALRCSTPQASDTILGQGWASQGYSAVDVDPSTRGVGYLLAEGGVPRRIKSFYLSDGDLDVLARRGEALRNSTTDCNNVDAHVGNDSTTEGKVIPIDPAA